MIIALFSLITFNKITKNSSLEILITISDSLILSFKLLAKHFKTLSPIS